ncbi:MAG: two-component regulator propeller domain-containing protein, partial [Sphingobacteriales bacterium]
YNAYWIGTNSGLWIINKHTAKVQHLVESAALPSNHITAICVTPNGNVYAATDKGIFRFDGYTYLSVNTDNAALPTDDITAMVCDKDGNVWIGTKDKGLVLMSNYRFRIFNNRNSILTDNAVKGMTKDAEENIYVQLANGSIVKIGKSGMHLEDISQIELNGFAKTN